MRLFQCYKNNSFMFLVSKFLVKLTIIFMTGVMSVLAFNNAIAWFSGNKEVEGTGMRVKMKYFDAEATYFTYVFDKKTEDVRYTGQTVDKNGNPITFTPPTLQNLDMQFYDTIFKMKNRHTPAIVRIRLTDIAQERLSGGKVSITLSRDTSIPEYKTKNSEKKLNDYITSMMRFSLAQNKNWYNANALTMYNVIDSVLYPQIVTNKNYSPAGSSAVFTEVTKTNDVISDINKSDSITISTSYTQGDIVDGHLDVYVFITYDEDLVDDYDLSDMNIEGTTISHVTTLENDFKELRISFSDN